MDLASQFILLQAFATWFVFGLISFVQIVHYPLLKNVGTDEFGEYERKHVARTTLVVGGPMIIELVTAVAALFLWPPSLPQWLVYVGILLLVVIWISSFCLQVPQHYKLKDGFQDQAWKILVYSNWIRTFAWGARSLLLAWAIVCM